MKRLLAITALAVFGAVWTAGSVYADRPRLQGRSVYIYPEGTTAYYVGPGGYRSDYYVIPPVSNGAIGPNTGTPSGYYGPSTMNNYNNNTPSNSDYRWRRTYLRPYRNWDR